MTQAGDPPSRLADLRAGLRLIETETGVVWRIERIRRANTYATPWVHLVRDGEEGDRVEGAGSLICEPGEPARWRAL